MSTVSQTHTRALHFILAREVAIAYAINSLLTACLLMACVWPGSSCAHQLPATHWLLAIASQALFLNLYPGAISVLVFMLARGSAKPRFAAGIFNGGLLGIIALDVAAFRLFGCHINGGTVWHFLRTPDLQILTPGKLTLATLVLLFVALGLIGIWFSTRWIPRWASKPVSARSPLLIACGLLACITAERGMLLWTSWQDPFPTSIVAQTLSFYVPLDPKKVARKFGKDEPPLELHWRLDPMRLPRKPLGPIAQLKRPNIIVIAIEGARRDALNKTTMPHLCSLADDSWRMDQQFSTGNGTPLGMLGLFYSLSVNYFYAVNGEGVRSPAMTLFSDLGYQFRLLASADMGYSFLNKTAFKPFTNSITDHWSCASVERDAFMTKEFLRFLDMRKQTNASAPFFGFLFYDASHFPYECPAEDAILPAQALRGQVSLLAVLNAPQAAGRLKNSYLNALHYVDRNVNQVVQHLKETGDFESTIILVVGDHGEEFGECGHFSHNGSFNIFELQTLCILHLPGEAPRTVQKPSSHADLMPTILTWMGVTNAPGDYGFGIPIQSDHTHPYLVVGDLEERMGFIRSNAVASLTQSGCYQYSIDEEQAISSRDSRCIPRDALLKWVAENQGFFIDSPVRK